MEFDWIGHEVNYQLLSRGILLRGSPPRDSPRVHFHAFPLVVLARGYPRGFHMAKSAIEKSLIKLLSGFSSFVPDSGWTSSEYHFCRGEKGVYIEYPLILCDEDVGRKF